MSTLIDTIAALKSEWDALQPLSPDNDRRLWQKLRLEWNYHSNHIEGNTLTYGETELLLIHGQTHGNHTIREYEEMKAHDVGIAHLRELAADKTRLLGEGDIRDLNKIILKEPYWKPAQTPDGQATRKQIIPGEYKTTPNNVLTATGGLFEFAPPSDVPARMQALVQWLEDMLTKDEPQILPITAKLHHDFVLIHPFDDGNGRVARMLVNYVLMRHGYPPVIVPTQEKPAYLAALRLADAGDLTHLVEYFAQRLVAALGLGIRAAKGEKIEEPGDVEKEIELFIRSQQHHKEKVKPRSTEAIKALYDLGFRDLFRATCEKVQVFDPLFVQVSKTIDPKSQSGRDDPERTFGELLAEGYSRHSHFQLLFHLKGYRGEAPHPFNLQKVIRLDFSQFEYVVKVDNAIVARKLYSEPILSDESSAIVERMLAEIFASIKKQAKQG